MRIQADVGRCQGYGNCAGIDSAHFDLDDEGLVIVRRDSVTAAERHTVAEAVRSCPAEAIWLAHDAA
jgi:ferredoxin